MRFSVVIPTRNRPDTLRFAIETVLRQSFDDFELLVSDNHSDEETAHTIGSFGSPRLRSVRTETPLSMAQHWAFALARSRGEFVLFLGDDDGLLGDSLGQLDDILRTTRADILRWDGIEYAWPSCKTPGAANTLTIPLRRTLQVVGGHQVIRGVANGALRITQLPSPYTGTVRRSLLERVGAESGGVFAGACPDLYSGFVLAHAQRRHHSLTAPLSIWGSSGHSIGSAALYHRHGSRHLDEFLEANAKVGFSCDPRIPDVPALAAIVADMFLQAKSRTFPHDRSLILDRRRLLEQCVDAAPSGPSAERERWLEEIRASVEGDHSLQRALGAILQKPRSATPSPARVPFGMVNGRLILDAQSFGVQDTLGAALLCERLLGSGLVRELFDAGPLGLYSRVRTALRLLIRGR